MSCIADEEQACCACRVPSTPVHWGWIPIFHSNPTGGGLCFLPVLGLAPNEHRGTQNVSPTARPKLNLFLFDPCANLTTALSFRKPLLYLFVLFCSFVLSPATCFDTQNSILSLHVCERFDGGANVHLPPVPLKTDGHIHFAHPQFAPQPGLAETRCCKHHRGFRGAGRCR